MQENLVVPAVKKSFERAISISTRNLSEEMMNSCRQ